MSTAVSAFCVALYSNARMHIRAMDHCLLYSPHFTSNDAAINTQKVHQKQREIGWEGDSAHKVRKTMETSIGQVKM